MGCGSCGKGRANVKYEVTWANGTRQKYDSVTEAQHALRAAGNPQGSSFRAVPA